MGLHADNSECRTDAEAFGVKVDLGFGGGGADRIEEGQEGASQVSGAKYDPDSNVLTLTLSDGATVGIIAGDGEVER